jgi:hypothetical protein
MDVTVGTSGALQMFPLQMPLVQSLPNAQILPTAHFGQLPPQSTSVSMPFLTASVQVGALATHSPLPLQVPLEHCVPATAYVELHEPPTQAGIVHALAAVQAMPHPPQFDSDVSGVSHLSGLAPSQLPYPDTQLLTTQAFPAHMATPLLISLILLHTMASAMLAYTSPGAQTGSTAAFLCWLLSGKVIPSLPTLTAFAAA